MNELTIVVCVYNAEHYIKETIDAILRQTFKNYNLLFIDDCSTDNSVRIINGAVLGKREYNVVSLPKNSGIAYVRDYALRSVKTKYILFIDSDDLLDPTLVEKEYNKISSEEKIIGVSCWSEYINEKGEKISGGTYLGEINKDNFIEKAKNKKLIFLPIHTMFSVKDALLVGGFRTEGFPKGCPRYQDYCEELDLWTRMSDLYIDGKALITIPEVLYYYRKSDGLSSNHFNMILKMRYTKVNLLRRRNGEKELTFTEFYDGLSTKDLNKFKRDANAADYLRNGVFYLKKKNFFKGGWMILKSVWYKPGYIFDKVRHNFKLKK